MGDHSLTTLSLRTSELRCKEAPRLKNVLSMKHGQCEAIDLIECPEKALPSSAVCKSCNKRVASGLNSEQSPGSLEHSSPTLSQLFLYLYPSSMGTVFLSRQYTATLTVKFPCEFGAVQSFRKSLKGLLDRISKCVMQALK